MALAPALLGWAGCGSSSSEPAVVSANGTLPPQAVLSAQQSADILRSGEVLLLAADSVAESSPAPLLGGAIRVDVDELTAFSETEDAFTNPAGFQERFRAWGVRADRSVLIYDNGDMKFAARVHFLLSHFGGPTCYIINGGAPALAGLLPAGGGVARPSNFVATPTDVPIVLVFQDEVLALVGTSVKIVDVRSPMEFDGSLLLPGDARPGHIPGAINLPESRFFDSQGLLLGNEQLANVFRSAGLSPQDSIVAYCHDGAKSSLAATLLVASGFPNISLYYLSYRDWSENFALPVEL
jgi:thiosulfate/3-mercaptopyruvate sulfurtransferase